MRDSRSGMILMVLCLSAILTYNSGQVADGTGHAPRQLSPDVALVTMHETSHERAFNTRGELAVTDIPGFTGIPIASEGDPAPGTSGNFVSFQSVPAVSNTKHVAFWADTDSQAGIFHWFEGEIQPLVFEGDPAPGTFGQFASFSKDISINNDGLVAFSAWISGAGDVTMGVFLASTNGVSPIAVRGDCAPDGGELDFLANHRPVVNSNGDVYFFGTIADGPGDLGNNGAIFVYRVNEGTEIIAATDASFPGAGFFTSINAGPWVSGDGAIVFRGTVNGLRKFFRYRDGEFIVVASRTDPAPGTSEQFNIFSEQVSVPNAIETYFSVAYVVSPTTQGIFKHRVSGEVVNLMLNGDESPLPGVLHGNPGFVNANPLGSLFFQSQLSGGSSNAGIFRLDQSTGQTHTLLLEGDPAPGVEGRLIDDVGFFSINDIGDWSVAFRATDNKRHAVFFDQNPPGDLDQDDDVDSNDYSQLQSCLTGPGVIPSQACEKADLNTDGQVDLTDFKVLQQVFIECTEDTSDCNGNGASDRCEVEGSLATDCDENGILDQCETVLSTSPDCNLDILPDSCNIQQGTSLDLDSNGVPDECQ